MPNQLVIDRESSFNSIVLKCENILIQSPWIGITWICQSNQSCYWAQVNRIIQPTRITQMIRSILSNQYIVDLFSETFDFVSLFFSIFWINSILWLKLNNWIIIWIDAIIPVAQCQSTQSSTVWKRNDRITNQLAWKRN